MKTNFTTVLMSLVLMLGGNAVQSATVTWTNTAGGNWSIPANWSPNQIPGPGDTAVFPDVGNNYAVNLDVAASVSDLTIGATSGANTQTFNNSGQTLTVNGVIQVNSQGAFNLEGGEIAGTNALIGTLDWTGGMLTGVMTVSNTGVLNIVTTGNSIGFQSLTLTNYGTVNWTNTTINSGQGTQIYNCGLWNAQSDNDFGGGAYGGVTAFDNIGTFRKSGNTGTTALDGAVLFNNTGLVDVEQGTLSVVYSGTNSGSGAFTTVPGAILVFPGSYTFANGANFAGGGIVELPNGAVINGTFAATNVQWSGGTISGTNVLVGSLDWTGGTLIGVMTISNAGVLNIATTGNSIGFELLTLTNYGTINWTNTTINSGQGTQIYNYGLWNAQSDNDFGGGSYGGVTAFDNFGTFRKSGNTGTTALDGAVLFNNTGLVDIEQGTLSVVYSGTNSGSGAFTATPGAILDFPGSYTFANGANFAGGGTVELPNGAVINGIFAATNVQWSGGTISGTNVLVGNLDWTGGTLTGVMTVSNNGVLNIATPGNNIGFEYLTLTNDGTVNWTNTTINSGVGTQIYNYGLWNAQSDNSFQGGAYGGVTVFDNFGTFRKSGNTGTTTLDGAVLFNNTGLVDVEQGTLSVVYSGINSGSGAFTTAPGTTLVFPSSFTFANGADFAGGGTVELPNGAVINGIFAATNVQWSGGTISGTNVLVGNLDWTGGTLTGIMTVSNNGVLNIATPGNNIGFAYLTLTNYGTVNWTNTTINSGVGTQIYNYGLWNAQSDNGFQGGAYGGVTVFDNIGTFRKSGNAGITTLDGSVLFGNTGLVDVEQGTLSIGYSGFSSGSGAFTTAPGATLLFSSSFTFANGANFAGGGTVELPNGAVINGIFAATNVQWSGGTISGASVLVGSLDWTGGTLGGVMTVSNTGVLNIMTAGNNIGFGSLTLTNYGTVDWTNTTINSGQGTQIYNYGLWNAQSDNGFQGGAYGGVTTFNNFGTFRKSGNTGTTTLDGGVLFTNAGTVDAQSGTVDLNTYDLTGGTLNFGISSPTSFGVISLAGSAALTGTVSANLNSNYVPSVSDSFQVLNFSSSSGGFTNFSSPLGVIWQTNYAATSFTLTYAGQIVWATPTNITYGIALGVNQLDASTTPTVAGTFTYNPVVGTVLDSGIGQWLTAAFSPAAPPYAPASFQVPITVLKAPLGITADTETKTYGQNFIFTGTQFVATGLVNGDTVTNVSFTSTGAISNAPVSGSPYEITPYNAEGDAGLTNYIITYTNNILTVNRAPLGITADSFVKTYGSNFVFTSQEFVSTVLSNNETIGSVNPSSLGAISNAPVSGSPYSISPGSPSGGTFSPGNYAITYTNGTLTVLPAPLTVTANPASRQYGLTNPTFSASYSGFVNNETASVVSGVPSFNTPATVASGIGAYSITPSLGTLTAANYTFAAFDTGSLTITAAPLVVSSGLTANNKVYNRTVAATLSSNNVVLSTIYNGDPVGLNTNGYIANFASSNVANGIAVTVTGLTLNGVSSTNYTLTQPSLIANITAAPVTINSGITANSKVYNGNTTATLSSNNVILTGVINGDSIILNTNGYVANFASSNVANGIAVTVSGLTLSGTRAGNYTLAQPSGLAPSITAAPVTITSGLTANSKIYNRTTVATLSSNNVVFSGVIGSDTVILNTNGYVANFASSNAANGIAVSVSGLTLSGASAANYALTQPGSLTANITEAPVTITSGITANNKVYDRTTTATLSSNNVVLSGVINGDTAILNTNAYTATFASAGVGDDISVTVSGLTLSGSSASDYLLTQPNGLTADITAPEVQISPSLTNIVVSWPTNAAVFVLNQTASLVPPITWSPVTNSVTVNGANNTVRIGSEGAKNQFFELIAAP